MRKYLLTFQPADSLEDKRTLLVDGIPENYCYEEIFLEYFHNIYPDKVIDSVEVKCNVSKLERLREELCAIEKSLESCEEYSVKNGGKKIKMTKCGLGLACCCS